ncbi:MAG: fold hydrolase [Patescibacteria group bacterium]|jgi:metallo-beta-lactamase family protein|nr:fold hydrolase [Patescibacteria group bacterium]
MSNLKIKFCGGAGSVTGANFLIYDDNIKVLVDCGLEQGSKMAETTNWEPFPYNPKEIDFLLVTHAHTDHIGRIPKLIHDGFSGKIISTPATKDLSRIMLEDTARILSNSESGKKFGLDEIYSEEVIQKIFSIWDTEDLHKEFSLNSDVKIYMKDSGHILGSSMFIIDWSGKKIVFTGDLGNSPSPLLPDTEYIDSADYVIMESVYGDRNHEERNERRENLKKIMNENHKKSGILVVPIFSLERTQEFLYEMNELIEGGEVPHMSVYVDSPLAIKVTDIFYKYKNLFKESVRNDIKKGDDIFNFKGLRETEKTSDSKAILNSKNPKIIMAGSGMSAGGRIMHHEKNYLGDPNATILITGFQTPGTPGRLLLDGAKEINIFDETVKINAQIKMIKGYSGHRDSNGLFDFVSNIKDVKKVFLAMGEPRVAMFFAQRINDNLPTKAVVPEKDQEFIL